MNKRHFSAKSPRLPGHDYAQNGTYFITIVTHQRAHLFGHVVADRVQLSPIGHIVRSWWVAIPDHHAHIELDVYVVMPNHFHGIITILDHPTGGYTPEAFQKPVTGSIPTIVRSYKSGVTRSVREIPGKAALRVWQPRFYDRVVRTETELNHLRAYILGNPARWTEDDLYG